MAVRSGVGDFAGFGYFGQVSGLLNADTSKAFDVSRCSLVTVQAVGTFGAGGTVTLQGSNDGVTWGGFGTAVTLTDSSIKSIPGGFRYLRANVTGGDGTTSLALYVAGTV